MRPVILTNVTGDKVRINPMNMIGWAPADVPAENSRILLGSAVALVDGARLVRESVEQIDHLFERATDGWMRPPVTREQLEDLMNRTSPDAAVRASALDEDAAQG